MTIMLKNKQDKIDCGVLVGRFQTHELHQGHIDLIKTIVGNHPKTIIFLGLSPCRVTRNNPLDFESRKQMILKEFPDVNVLYIKDTPTDDVWSKSLDEKIGDIIGPNQTVVLYGSRDCFIKHYTGKYKTQELLQETYVSGSEVRNSISKKVKNTAEFRKGVIWAAYNQYPKVWATVDIAIMDEDENRVLLARKPNEAQYRFIGGFAEPNSDSYEQDAKREVMEEAGVEVSEMEYLGSFKISDWRYEQEMDKIKTVFFKCRYMYGRPQANDDVCEVRWFDIKDFDIEILVSNHKKLMKVLLEDLTDDRKTITFEHEDKTDETDKQS